MSSSVAEGPLWGGATSRVIMLENQMKGLKITTMRRSGRAMPPATPQAWTTPSVLGRISPNARMRMVSPPANRAVLSVPSTLEAMAPATAAPAVFATVFRVSTAAIGWSMWERSW